MFSAPVEPVTLVRRIASSLAARLDPPVSASDFDADRDLYLREFLAGLAELGKEHGMVASTREKYPFCRQGKAGARRAELEWADEEGRPRLAAESSFSANPLNAGRALQKLMGQEAPLKVLLHRCQHRSLLPILQGVLATRQLAGAATYAFVRLFDDAPCLELVCFEARAKGRLDPDQIHFSAPSVFKWPKRAALRSAPSRLLRFAALAAACLLLAWLAFAYGH